MTIYQDCILIVLQTRELHHKTKPLPFKYCEKATSHQTCDYQKLCARCQNQFFQDKGYSKYCHSYPCCTTYHLSSTLNLTESAWEGKP
ncbi:hypothetical protein PN476_05295, partial [Dolichospermum circinale CS-537/05]|nr:hypothetical protein [Dolichospermum circinale CS-537/05]